ncbi:hypothetical protein K439DRAFT_1612489 [Ramaria rubella]|nr:hypothetical protein K439DRAFT_1612489 [Ramaria rubella]
MNTVFKQRLTQCEWDVLGDIKSVLEPVFALQVVMCAEKTPILACIIPTFYSLLATWDHLHADPSKVHLKKMLDTGIEKMTAQYNEHRFAKLTIIAITFHPALCFRWIEQNWPASYVEYAQKLILSELAKFDNLHAAGRPTRDVVRNTHPSHNAYKFLFPRNMNSNEGATTNMPSIDEEWSSYCHAANWPNIFMDPVEWWDSREIPSTNLCGTGWGGVLQSGSMCHTVTQLVLDLVIEVDKHLLAVLLTLLEDGERLKVMLLV